MIYFEDKVYGIVTLAPVFEDWYIDITNSCRTYFKLNKNRNKVIEHTLDIPDIVKEKLNDKAKNYIQNFALEQ